MSTECSASNVLPTYFSLGVLGLYVLAVLIAAFTSFKHVRNEKGSKAKLISFLKDMSRKKKCYFEFLPHLVDIATDGAVIWEFYIIARRETCELLNMWAILYLSVGVVLFYRVMSACLIYYYTHNEFQAVLQLLDLEFARALLVNYRTDATQPCRPQLWISNLEAIFESTPQACIQLVFLISTNTLYNEFSIVQVSLLFSIFTIILRNTNNDALLFTNIFTDRVKNILRESDIPEDEWKTMPTKKSHLLPFRFCDILIRISLLSISYILYPYYVFVGINAVYFSCYVIYAARTRHFEYVNSFIRVDLTKPWLVMERFLVNFLHLASLVAISYFGFISKPGIAFFTNKQVYYGTCISLVALYVLEMFLYDSIRSKMNWIESIREEYFGEVGIFHESTDIEHLIHVRRWQDILDLVYFGFNYTPQKLLDYSKVSILQHLGEDINEGGQALFDYIEKDTTFNEKNYSDLWIGFITAYENKAAKDSSDKLILDKINRLMVEQTSLGYSSFINNQTLRWKRALLHLVCLKQEVNLFQTILLDFEKKIDYNVFDKNHNTALNYCIKNDNAYLCHSLLAKPDIDLNHKNNLDETYLHFATLYSANEEISLMLLDDTIHGGRKDKSEKIEQNPLLAAAGSWDVNAVDSLGNTVLHYSLFKTYFLQKLLTIFADSIDLNVTENTQNITPLFNFVCFKHNNVGLQLLLQYALSRQNSQSKQLKSVNWAHVDACGNNILHYAVSVFKPPSPYVPRANYHVYLLLNSGIADFDTTSLANNPNREHFGGVSALHLCFMQQKHMIADPDNPLISQIPSDTDSTKSKKKRKKLRSKKQKKKTSKPEDKLSHSYFQHSANFVNESDLELQIRHSPENVKLLLKQSYVNADVQCLRLGNTCLHYGVDLYEFETYRKFPDLLESQLLKLRLVLAQDKKVLPVTNKNGHTCTDLANDQLNLWKEKFQVATKEVDRLESELGEARKQLVGGLEQLEQQRPIYERAKEAYDRAKPSFDSAKSEMESTQLEYGRELQDFNTKMERFSNPQDTMVTVRPSSHRLDLLRARVASSREIFRVEQLKFAPIEHNFHVEKGKFDQIQSFVSGLKSRIKDLQSQLDHWQYELKKASELVNNSQEILKVLQTKYNMLSAPNIKLATQFKVGCVKFKMQKHQLKNLEDYDPYLIPDEEKFEFEAKVNSIDDGIASEPDFNDSGRDSDGMKIMVSPSVHEESDSEMKSSQMMHAHHQLNQMSVELPAGWEKRYDQGSGRYYYVDHQTKQTQWHRPKQPQSPQILYKSEPSGLPVATLVAIASASRGSFVGHSGPASPRSPASYASHASHGSASFAYELDEEEALAQHPERLPPGWEMKTDPKSGRTYFLDHTTKTSHWTLPDTVHATENAQNTGNEVRPDLVQLPSASIMSAPSYRMMSSVASEDYFRAGSGRSTFQMAGAAAAAESETGAMSDRLELGGDFLEEEYKMSYDNKIVYKWLESVGYAQYYNHFVNNGYKTEQDMNSITKNDCNKVGITKYLHVKKIVNKAREARQEQEVNEVVKDAQNGKSGAVEEETVVIRVLSNNSVVRKESKDAGEKSRESSSTSSFDDKDAGETSTPRQEAIVKTFRLKINGRVTKKVLRVAVKRDDTIWNLLSRCVKQRNDLRDKVFRFELVNGERLNEEEFNETVETLNMFNDEEIRIVY